MLLRENCQSCFGETCGRILELWARKATHHCNFSTLFCRSWGDDNAERRADAGGLDSDVSEGGKYSTGTFYLRIFVSRSEGGRICCDARKQEPLKRNLDFIGTMIPGS